MTDAAKNAIRRLVNDLAAGSYEAVASDGRIGRLTKEELGRAIIEYGRTLVPLPNEAIDLADASPISQAAGELLVDVPLWTAEEGRSDLTLTVRLVDADDRVVVSIVDLHVL